MLCFVHRQEGDLNSLRIILNLNVAWMNAKELMRSLSRLRLE